MEAVDDSEQSIHSSPEYLYLLWTDWKYPRMRDFSEYLKQLIQQILLGL